MADKKKPIKQCRVKADTCFKWHCMGKLFGLNLEDIGLAYLISQIKDDENNIRYGLIEEEILDMFKETEAEWLALHNAKMRTDPTYRIAFADLNGQRTATTNHYKAEVARREAYNDRIKKQNGENAETGNLTEDVTTSSEMLTIPKVSNIEYSECELNKDIISVLNPFTDEISEYEETENYLLKYYKFKNKEVGIYGHMAIMPSDENFEEITRNLTNVEMSSILKNIEMDGGLCQELYMYIKNFEDEEETPF